MNLGVSWNCGFFTEVPGFQAVEYVIVNRWNDLKVLRISYKFREFQGCSESFESFKNIQNYENVLKFLISVSRNFKQMFQSIQENFRNLSEVCNKSIEFKNLKGSNMKCMAVLRISKWSHEYQENLEIVWEVLKVSEKFHQFHQIQENSEKFQYVLKIKDISENNRELKKISVC